MEGPSPRRIDRTPEQRAEHEQRRAAANERSVAVRDELMAGMGTKVPGGAMPAKDAAKLITAGIFRQAGQPEKARDVLGVSDEPTDAVDEDDDEIEAPEALTSPMLEPGYWDEDQMPLDPGVSAR